MNLLRHFFTQAVPKDPPVQDEARALADLAKAGGRIDGRSIAIGERSFIRNPGETLYNFAGTQRIGYLRLGLPTPKFIGLLRLYVPTREILYCGERMVIFTRLEPPHDFRFGTQAVSSQKELFTVRYSYEGESSYALTGTLDEVRDFLKEAPGILSANFWTTAGKARRVADEPDKPGPFGNGTGEQTT